MAKSLNAIIPYVIYPFDIMFSFAETDAELKEKLSKVGCKWDELLLCEGDGRCTMLQGGQTIVRLKHYPKENRHYGILQHEIFHAVDMLFRHIGIKLNEDSSEAYAYLIQYLTTEIYKCLK